jgi:hypothetical protein
MRKRKMHSVFLVFSFILMCGLIFRCGGNGSEKKGDADADVEVQDVLDSESDVQNEQLPEVQDGEQEQEGGETPVEVTEIEETQEVAEVADVVDVTGEEVVCDPPLVYHPGTGTCVSTEGIGVHCEIDTDCLAGQTCVEYSGLAGPRKECYIECGPRPDRLCPEGFWCMDAMDGPQNVCMPQD